VGDPVLLHRLAAIEVRAGMSKDAAEHYEELLKLAPKSVEAMVALAQLYSGPAGGVRNFNRARDLVNSARELEPNDGQIAWTLGSVLFAIGDYKRSADILEAAAEALPHQPALAFDLARSLYMAGRAFEAEANLSEALASDTPFAQREAAQRLASLIAGGKNPEQAEAALADARKTLAENPDSVPAMMVLALSREKQADYPGAKQKFEQILASDPLFAPATRQLAILYAEHFGDDKKAEELAMKVLLSYPDDPVLPYELGALNYRKGEFIVAIRFMQESLHKRENNAEALFYLGMSYYAVKNTTAARDALQKAAGLNLPLLEADAAKRVLDELSQSDSGLGTPGPN
jgi:tetratricopeptide (TPR) repeat protein